MRYKLYQRIKSTVRLRKRGLNTTNFVCENASVSRLLLLLLFKKLFSTRLRSQDSSTLPICSEFSRYRSPPFAGSLYNHLFSSFYYLPAFIIRFLAATFTLWRLFFLLFAAQVLLLKLIRFAARLENHFDGLYRLISCRLKKLIEKLVQLNRIDVIVSGFDGFLKYRRDSSCIGITILPANLQHISLLFLNFTFFFTNQVFNSQSY